MKMQRRHFEFIAGNLLATQPTMLDAGGNMTEQGNQWGHTVIRFTDQCDQTNDYFKRGTFLDACGMTDDLQKAGGWS